MVDWYLAFLAVIGCERLAELVISRRNAAWSHARGGIEVGQRHFGVMAVLHGALLAGAIAEVALLHRPLVPSLAFIMLAATIVSECLRLWCIRTLGPRWNVRIIVIPGDAPVAAGPYRYLRHPNYVAVIVEGIAIPLVHTAWITALTFTVLNALLLSVRIRTEERALSKLRGYDETFVDRNRFVPRRRSVARMPGMRVVP